jgi:DeoR family transcriptional regulator, suf operon transcriptional repressor
MPLTQSSRPAGQRGPRSEMLLALKRAGQLTAKELAGHLGLSLNAVRHHLKELEVEQLVVYERQHRGVGAPVFAYRLSAAASESLFPRRYEETLTQLLEQVAAREGRAGAVAMLEGRFESLAARLREQLVGEPPEHRMEIVTRALADEGYMAEWQASGQDGATLKEHNCAIQAVAERYPEICVAERRFLEEVLSAAVDRKAHILAGCSACEYHVQFDDGAGPAGVVQITPRVPRPGELA